MVLRRFIFPLILIVVFASCYSVPRPEASGRSKVQTMEPDGFRGIAWGADLAAMSDMTNVYTDESTGLRQFTRQPEKMRIGDAEIKRITYFGFLNKFSSVMITTEGYSDWRSLHKAAIAKYGKPRQPNEYIEQYYWWFGKTTISLKYTRYSEEATMVITSVELQRQRQQYEKQRAAKAAEDF